MIAFVTAATSAAKASLAQSTSSGDLILVKINGASVDSSICLRHDDISFVLGRSMC